MKRLLAGLAVPVLSLSLVTACSNNGDAEGDTDASASTPAEGSSESPETSEDESADASAQPTEPGEDPSADGDAAADAPGAGSRYCELLSTDFATLFASIQGPEDVKEAVAVIEQIADAAPQEVTDEWSVMKGALGSMQGALTRAAELQKKAESGQVSPEKLQKQTAELMKDMEALNTPENNEAGDAVAKHAADYCGLQLG